MTPPEASLVGSLVAVVTDDLVVRSQPGTGPSSDIYMTRMNAPLTVYVVAGPERSDGYDWYLVDPVVEPCYLGCDYVPQMGWVAAAAKDGERWLAAEPLASAACPERNLHAIIHAPAPLWLFCFGQQELELEGVLLDAEADHHPGWPWQHSTALMELSYPPPAGCVDVCSLGLGISYNDAEAAPPPLTHTRVVGHFSDKQAAACESWSTEMDASVAIHTCRMEFVVTGWSVVSE